MPSAPTLLAFAAAATAPRAAARAEPHLHRQPRHRPGAPAALASTLGVTTATAVFVVLTAFGLTALIASSTIAFSAVKYAGVAYLGYLAVREFRPRAVSGSRLHRR